MTMVDPMYTPSRMYYRCMRCQHEFVTFDEVREADEDGLIDIMDKMAPIDSDAVSWLKKHLKGLE